MTRESQPQPTASSDSEDVPTLANRRHIALRATLPRIVHDVMNPLATLRMQVYSLKSEVNAAQDNPSKHADAFKEMAEIVAGMDEMVNRGMDEVKALKTLFNRQEGRMSCVLLPVVLMAVVRSIDAGCTRVSLALTTQRKVDARLQDLELAFASFVLHGFEATHPTEAAPLLIAACDIVEEKLVRVSIAARGQLLDAPASQGDPRLREAEEIICSYGGHVLYGASTVIDLPFAKAGPAT